MGKTTQTDKFKRLRAMMKDVNGGNRQIVRALQDQVEYLLAKVAILEEIATEENGGKVPVYSEAQKKRLAQEFMHSRGLFCEQKTLQEL